MCLLSGFLGGALSFGSAVALALAPPGFILLPPAQAVVATALLSNVSNILVLSERRPKRVWWREWRALVFAATPGLLIGAWLLHDLNRREGELAVGVVVLAGLALQSRFQFKRERRLGTSAVGFVGGVLTTSVGFSGPLVSLWLLARTRDRLQMRDTLNAYFLFTGLMAPLVLIALVGTRAALPALWLLGVLAIAVFCGYEIGKRWFHRLASEDSYRKAARILLASLAVLSLTVALL